MSHLEEEENFRVAFLVDARRRVAPTDKPAEAGAFARGVSLSVLRLLTFFAHAGDAGRGAVSRLRWGLKVFHSYDYPPCRRDYLKELSPGRFGDFEAQLAGELDSLSSSSSWVRGGRRAVPRTPQVLAATSLRQALDDVGHDFQWDGPEVSSPVKRDDSVAVSASPRRRTRSTHGQRSDGSVPRLQQARRLPSKCVFLLMPCPNSRPELEEFCDLGPDDPSPSPAEFLEMLLPRGSSHQTFRGQNIALFWIDTSPWIVTEKRNNEGLTIVSAAMAELGGCVIPVHALATQNQHITASLQSKLSSPNLLPSAAPPTAAATATTAPSTAVATTAPTTAAAITATAVDSERSSKENSKQEHEKRRSCCACLPFPSVMHHYLRGGETGPPNEDMATKVKLCSVKDGQVTDLCLLEVCPLLKHSSAKASSSPLRRNPRASPSKPPSQTPSRTRLAVVTPGWSRHFDLTQAQPRSPDATGSADLRAPPPGRSRCATGVPSDIGWARATLRATLPAGAVPLAQYQAGAVYTCTGLAPSPPGLAVGSGTQTEVEDGGPVAKGGRPKVKLSTWFKHAMIDLSQQRKVLLLDMPHPETSQPTLAVLEPLTTAAASLRLLESWPLPGAAPPRPGEASLAGHGRGKGRAARLRRGGRAGVTGNVVWIAAEAAKRRLVGEEWLASQQGVQGSLTSSSPSAVPCDTVSFRPHHLEPWFSYCPSGGASTRLIDQLQSIPYREKCLKSDSPLSVSHILQQLEKVYSRQPGAVLGLQNVAAKHPEEAESQTKTSVDAGQGRQSPSLKKRKSKINIGFRTERIMQISMQRIRTSKEPSPPKRHEKGTRPAGIARNRTVPFECPKFDSEQDVVDCIRASYEKSLAEGACPMDCVQTTTSLVLSYMKRDNTETKENDPVRSARDLLACTLLASSNQLRDKHQARTDEAGRLDRVREIELQVLLRLEMEAVSPTEVGVGVMPGSKGNAGSEGQKATRLGSSEEDEGTQLPENVQVLVDEIVRLLRTVPFLADPSRLTVFLSESLLQNYADSLPHVLRAIYEDLMQPVPSVLLSPGSGDDDAGLSSVRSQQTLSGQPSSQGSFAEPSISSVRTRSLARHPSLADMGSRRVIPVPSRNAATKKEKVKVKKNKEEAGTSAKGVRRNLFMGGVRQSPRKGGGKLQRSQSVAVMQTVPGNRKSPRRRTPRKGLVLKTRVVKETPGKKQVVQAMLKKQERARRISTASGEAVIPPTPMRVVEESPLKPLPAESVRRSPRIKPRHPGDRRSFYSTSSCSDLASARDLAARIGGRKSRPASTATAPAVAAPAPAPAPAPTTTAAAAAEPATRTSLLSEICSPETLSHLRGASAGEAGPLSSPKASRSDRMQRTPCKDSPPLGTSGTSVTSPGDSAVFKTPTRVPRRVGKSPLEGSATPPRRDTAAPETTRTTGADASEGSLLTGEGRPVDTAGGTHQFPETTSERCSRAPHKHRRSPTAAQRSSARALASPEGGTARSLSPAASPPARSQTPDKGQRGHSRTASGPTLSVDNSSESQHPDCCESNQAVTPSRRSRRLQMTVGDGAEAAPHTEPHSLIAGSQGGGTEPVPRARKRTLADRSPPIARRGSPALPSPSSSPPGSATPGSATPGSLQKWQRRKRPRRDSPPKVAGPARATPPSAARRGARSATPSPAASPVFGKVTPVSERRKRASATRRGSARKPAPQAPATGEGTRQYKLGKVCRANVNLLTLMKDLEAPGTGQMQTRNRSSEGAPDHPSSPATDQQAGAYTFLDSHLDDSDDSDVDFPKMISPLRPSKPRAGHSSENLPGTGSDRLPPGRSPELSAGSSPSFLLPGEEEEDASTEDEVFPEASPRSGSKRRPVTTPLTTGGLFELMNSPMVASGQQKRVTLRPKVAFNQSARRGGRQLYPTEPLSGSPSVSGHTMARRSSSLGLRRLSSDSPTGPS